MTLSFSQKWPAKMGKWAGHPTYFVDSIWESIVHNYDHIFLDHSLDVLEHYLGEYEEKFGSYWPERTSKSLLKTHTIRKGNHWKVGDKIHMVIDVECGKCEMLGHLGPCDEHEVTAPKPFQFAPVLEAKSVQSITIGWESERPIVFVGNELFLLGEDWTEEGIIQLATNNSFESVDQFFTCFNEPFEGQIISWVEGVEY